MNDLQYTISYARIGIRTQNAQLNMQTQNARLEITSEKPLVKMTSSKPQLIIDQRECFASSGLKSYSELTQEAANRGRQQALEFIGKEASDGNLLAAIERGGNPLAQIAKRDAYPQKQFGMVSMPSAPPKIDYIPGELKIEPPIPKMPIHPGYSAEYYRGKSISHIRLKSIWSKCHH